MGRSKLDKTRLEEKCEQEARIGDRTGDLFDRGS